ncbi:XRE family transcriptional regulator [Halomonas sp. HP20-15]|uniref:XRE family transcriptional regulator n=1 Tax=Halomonas sp. HP20-15 TaxID=3085901 RepID=UPI002981C625|nr:XRE family transcriptional regulator [Halomonas sp. HP20-15]MDW5378334.1 XRE family transcriptional regulator [Halomonas sp. HP20-15]
MDKRSLDTLGRHLQALRQARGWSLSQLAAQAGIAKSNLSRLEQGDGNPTLDTLWRLAMRLEVPFGTLVAPITAVLGEEGVTVQLIDQGRDNPPVDAYWMRCEAHTHRRAEAHSPGTREFLNVVSGKLMAGPVEAMQPLAAGERLDFPADRAHAYRTEAEAATFLMTIVYTGSDTA